MRFFNLFLGGAVAALLMMSCNKDTRIADNADLGVNFRITSGALTKATPTTVANLGSFKVTAIGNSANFFTDLNVAVTSAGVCTPEKTYYWPGYELGFYAYANPSGGTASITNAAKGVAGVAPVAAAANQQDFVVAYSTGTKAANMASGVALNFRHALSQIKVKAANKSTAGLKINVKGVKVANVKAAGDFSYPAAVTAENNAATLDFALWNTGSASKTAYTIGGASETAVALSATAADIMFSGASWMLVPQQLVAWNLASDKTNSNSNAYIGVYLQILDANNGQLYPATAGQYAYANVPVDTKWEPGKTYTYTLNFLDEAAGGGAGVDDSGNPVLGSPINFSLTVDDWDAENASLDMPGAATSSVDLTNCIKFSSPTAATFNFGDYGSSEENNILGYSFEYSTGNEWQTYNGATINFGNGTDLYIRGKNVNGFTEAENTSWIHAYLTGSNISCSGNIMKLIDYENDVTTIPCSSCFYYFFAEEDELISAPDLPATTLSSYCYASMFDGCTSLATAPELPATTLVENCYGGMFEGCTSLTTAPELPATTLTEYCYAGMFEGCTSLTTAPELPATTLTEYCYADMFSGCTSLTTAPELPATTLAENCYNSMFKGCTSLNYVKAAFTTTPSHTYTEDWLAEVALTGTFVKNSAATWNVTGNHGVPSGWSVETYTP